MRITIKGKAVVHDWRNQEVRDPAVLQSLHGLVYDESVFTEYLGGPEPENALRALLEEGGTLRFVYNDGRDELECVTEYEAKRQLNADELKLLKDYTAGQWSDGIGEGYASNSVDVCCYSIECQSRPEPAAVQSESTPTSPAKAPWDRIGSLQLAVQRGNPTAALALGHCYSEGTGVAKDEIEAFRLFERAAELGCRNAFRRLGECHAEGIGTPLRPEKATEYFRRAAEAGDGYAMGLLAGCYERGEGAPKDEAAAAHWYHRGVEARWVNWLAPLAACYEFGKGVNRDLQQALEYYEKALECGYQEVVSAIQRIEAELGKNL